MLTLSNKRLSSTPFVALFIGLVAIASIIEASYTLLNIQELCTNCDYLCYILPLMVSVPLYFYSTSTTVTAHSLFALCSLGILPIVKQFSVGENFPLSTLVFVDGATGWLLWLVTLVAYVVLLGSNNLKDKLKHSNYTNSFTALSTMSIYSIIISVTICFLTKNVFLFFIYFELILIPLIVLLASQGSRGNRLVAIKYLACFTLIGSIFLWVPILYMVELIGSTNFDNLQMLISCHTSSGLRKILFLSLLTGFFFKVPVVPMHHWLIIAHVEAPTSGSIILAALLLKIGGYGIYRFCFTLFPIESFIYSHYIIALSLFGYTVATVLAIRQVDVKRFIAYTSISHMNYSLMGLFSGSEVGVFGFFHTMISHGIIATAMFYLVGHLYSVLGYRDTVRVSGLADTLPIFSFFWFIFSVANMGLPLFSAFPGELFILIALSETCAVLPVFTFVGFFFTGVYTFLQINKMLFSTYRGSPLVLSINGTSDLPSRGIAILSVLLITSIALGLSPDLIACSLDS